MKEFRQSNLARKVFFEPQPGGKVRLVIASESVPRLGGGWYIPPEAVLFEHTLEREEWADIIASVSAGGKNDDRLLTAEKFHMSEGKVVLLKNGVVQ